MSKKLVIIGGVAGGASAATRSRRLDEKLEIILIERGEFVSFANCGLPYYIGGAIKERQDLLVTNVKDLKQRFNIDVRIFSEALSIDRENKKIKVKDLKNGTIYEESYDNLILSTGAAPLKPPLPGIDLDSIFTLRNIPDSDNIRKFIDEKKPEKAVVIGGGFIGIEMAENLRERSLNVTLIEMADQIMAPLDREMVAPVHCYLVEKGVDLILNDGVKSFHKEGEKTVVTTQGGKELEADMVILSIGVKPENMLAKEAGLEMGERGGIKTDEYMRTGDPSIYAIGDTAEIIDFVTGKPTLIPLAGPANKQGRTAADNISGRKTPYMGSQGTSVVKIFDWVAASTGANEKTLKQYGIPYKVSYTFSGSHASYYPGSQIMNIKLIFAPDDGKVLGAQIVGGDGVDKRADVFATAIRSGLTVYQLEELELAYAPPFSSAKDPANLAGMVAANILKGDMEQALWVDLDSYDKNECVLLDVREKLELRMAGVIEGSLHIPLNRLRDKLNELDKSKTYLIFCASGHRSYFAYRMLVNNGFKAKNFSGGFKQYKTFEEDQECLNKKTNKTEVITAPQEQVKPDEIKIDVELNACGIQCPGPVLKLKKKLDEINNGEVVKISATDNGFPKDIKSWCASSGNDLLFQKSEKGIHEAIIRKGKAAETIPSEGFQVIQKGSKELTLVVFSDDLDKAMAAFIIANGAASIGTNVNMFFTFWGLNILKKKEGADVKKDFLSSMFGAMMPKGADNLSLSKMHFGGMGTGIMKHVMKNKNVESLEMLIQSAIEQGVTLTACTMTMEIMGIQREELLDNIGEGGVASYLESATKANVNLFI